MSTTSDKKQRHPWRENIEAMTVAIVMAVMLKYFAVEAYQIPTGSMQPTLMGQEFHDRGRLAGEIKDRILVDKLSFHLRDPERWEVVIFKYPLNRAQNFVKRLVGMPGEHFRVRYGDLWRRSNEQEPWQILRRPANVQRDQWKAIDLGEPVGGEHWAVEGTPQGALRREGREVEAAGAAKLRFAAHGGGPILDTYTHGYPLGTQEAMAKFPEFHASNEHTVGDLRVSGRVRASEQLAALAIVLTEGTRSYRFEIPGPAAPRAEARIGVQWARNEIYDPRESTVEAPRLAAGAWIEFAAQNLDDQLTLELGDVRLALEIEPATDQTAGVTLELVGGGAGLDDLQVWRDIYYTEGHTASEWRIPEGCYFMMGDNTQDSSDSREWRLVHIEWKGAPNGERVSGNYREAPRPGMYRPDSNPIRERLEDGLTTFFRDAYGELHVFPTEQEIALPPGDSTSAAPFVPRHLITGRALAVFWPLSFSFSTYRVKWIH